MIVIVNSKESISIEVLVSAEVTALEGSVIEKFPISGFSNKLLQEKNNDIKNTINIVEKKFFFIIILPKDKYFENKNKKTSFEF